VPPSTLDWILTTEDLQKEDFSAQQGQSSPLEECLGPSPGPGAFGPHLIPAGRAAVSALRCGAPNNQFDQSSQESSPLFFLPTNAVGAIN